MKSLLLITMFLPLLLPAQIQKSKERNPLDGSKFITYKLKGKTGEALPITLTKYQITEDLEPCEFSFVQEITLQQYLKGEAVLSVELMMKDGSIIEFDDWHLQHTRMQMAFTGTGYRATVTSIVTKELINYLQKAMGIRVNRYGEGLRFYDDPDGKDAKEFTALVKFFKSEIAEFK